MAYQFLESMEDPFPTVGGFSMGGGKTTRTFRMVPEDPEEPLTNDDLVEMITDVLGGVDTEVGDGRIRRYPPLADPQFPWLFASSINSIRGRGAKDYTIEDAEPELEVPPVPQYPLAPQYDIVVEFTPRKYPIVLDESIQLYASSWYPDPNTDSTADEQFFVYADETARFTVEPQITSAFEFVAAQQGNMKFKTDLTTYNGIQPNNKAFPAKLKMPLPNMMLAVTTYMVPYRWLTSANSYITGGTARATWIGRVNQNPLYLAGMKFPPGSLQYVGFTPEIFSPPVPDRELFSPGVYSAEKLMNITFLFSYTLRVATDIGPDRPNLNSIQAG